MIQGKGEPFLEIKTLDLEDVSNIDVNRCACNYLAAGMIYLQENPLLRQPLKPEHVRNRLLSYWGASPGARIDEFAYEPAKLKSIMSMSNNSLLSREIW